MSATEDLRCLADRMRGGLGSADQEVVDHAAERASALRDALVDARTDLDDITSRIAALEGVSVASAPPTGWDGTTDHADELIAAWEQSGRQRSSDPAPTVLAAGEQLVGGLTAPPMAPEWVGEVLDRFPNVDEGTLLVIVKGGQSESLHGAMHLIRGFRGEQIVAEALASGALAAPPGTTGGELVESTSEPGLDLRLDVAGESVDAQVKITSGAGPVLDHYDRYPDVGIVYTSSDAADAVEGMMTTSGQPITVVRPGDAWPEVSGPIVVDIGSTSSTLSGETLEAFEGIAANANGGLLSDVVAELPVIAIAFIAARGAHRYVASDDDSADIRADVLRSSGNMFVNAGAGTFAGMVTGMDLVQAPVTLATGVLRNSWRQSRSSLDESIRRHRAIRSYLHQLGQIGNSIT